MAAVLPVRGIRGQASVALESLVLENGWPACDRRRAEARGTRGAAADLRRQRSLLPLGDYTVTFVPAPAGQLAAKFVDNGGPLEVAGTVDLDAARTYTIDVLVEPRAGAPEMLVEGLSS